MACQHGNLCEGLAFSIPFGGDLRELGRARPAAAQMSSSTHPQHRQPGMASTRRQFGLSGAAVVATFALAARALTRRASKAALHWRRKRNVSLRSAAQTDGDGQTAATANQRLAALAMCICLAVAIGAPGGAEAADQISSGGDWFDPFVNLNASIIAGIDSVVGSGGVAIVLYTILIKAVTYPLSQPALRTTALLKITSPQTQAIQKQYPNDEQQRNLLLRRLYEEVGINPFTGCLPILVQLPVFVALFRAIGRLAAQNPDFQSSFLWIPSLAGPVASGKPGLDWLLRSQAADHFEPLVGWGDALAYLVLPVLIVVSNLIVQRLGASSASTSRENGWLDNVFPWFIGMSTLVSPQGLGVYWLTNTVLTAGQTFVVNSQIASEFPEYKRIYDEAQQMAPIEEKRYTRESPFLKEEAVESAAVVESVKALDPPVAKAQTRTAKRSKKKDPVKARRR